MQKISIKKAVGLGTIFVNVPVFCFLIGGFVLTKLFAVSEIFPKKYELLILSGIFIGFVAAWLWWSFTVPLWRYWAYQRVESIKELKVSAIQAGLIWPQGSWFEKSEIKPKKLVALELELGEKLNT